MCRGNFQNIIEIIDSHVGIGSTDITEQKRVCYYKPAAEAA